MKAVHIKYDRYQRVEINSSKIFDEMINNCDDQDKAAEMLVASEIPLYFFKGKGPGTINNIIKDKIFIEILSLTNNKERYDSRFFDRLTSDSFMPGVARNASYITYGPGASQTGYISAEYLYLIVKWVEKSDKKTKLPRYFAYTVDQFKYLLQCAQKASKRFHDHELIDFSEINLKDAMPVIKEENEQIKKEDQGPFFLNDNLNKEVDKASKISDILKEKILSEVSKEYNFHNDIIKVLDDVVGDILSENIKHRIAANIVSLNQNNNEFYKDFYEKFIKFSKENIKE